MATLTSWLPSPAVRVFDSGKDVLAGDSVVAGEERISPQTVPTNRAAAIRRPANRTAGDAPPGFLPFWATEWPLLAAGDARRALRAFLRVVSPLWSGYREWAAAAQFEIGKCYLDLKKPKEAREAFRTVLEKHADTKWAEPAKEQLAKLPAPSGT